MLKKYQFSLFYVDFRTSVSHFYPYKYADSFRLGDRKPVSLVN